LVTLHLKTKKQWGFFLPLRPVGLEPTIPLKGDELKARYITNSVQGRFAICSCFIQFLYKCIL